MGAWTIGCSIPSISHTGVVTAFALSVIFAGHQVARLACLTAAQPGAAQHNPVSVPHLGRGVTQRQSPLCQSYEVGIDSADRRSQPWNFE